MSKSRAGRMPDRRQSAGPPIPDAPEQAYVPSSRGDCCPGRDMTMVTNRLYHDVEVAQRATLGIIVGLVIAAFVALAAGAAVYDIGKALTLW